ncbi:MAG: crotonase/enoyl-CoA hydratase family protein [Pseudomonadales bacterium]
MSERVHYSHEESIAIIRLDDGKANALSYAVLDELNAAFDQAEKDGVQAITLIGREGRFCAGFDLAEMGKGLPQAMNLALTGAELALRLFESPVPVVIGATGHALAMGAVLLLAVDERIGVDGAYKIGLNEVAIGMNLPGFALVLAEARLARRHLYRATSNAEIYTPAEAIDVGYLDKLAANAVAEEAIARAKVLAARLDSKAHAITKQDMRTEVLARLRASIANDRARFV